ncbi:unnamed protein product [Effrenium voratum]|nr:unnamed protein product [Effrenium voratum]
MPTRPSRDSPCVSSPLVFGSHSQQSICDQSAVLLCFPAMARSLARLAALGIAGLVCGFVGTSLQGCEAVTYTACSAYSKNGVGPITDKTICRTACETAEGLQPKNGQLEDWKGSSGAGKCECVTSTNGDRRTICQDDGYSA